jgi:hypothetical protein
MFRFSSGAGEVSGWAYQRTEPLPADDAALVAAKDALVAEASKRNGTLKVERSGTRKVAGAPAVEIVGTQTINGRPVRSHSVHFFRDGYEYVVEALAPEEEFPVADKGVLEPLLRTLRFKDA